MRPYLVLPLLVLLAASVWSGCDWLRGRNKAETEEDEEDAPRKDEGKAERRRKLAHVAAVAPLSLQARTSSHLLRKTYPTTDVRIELGIRYEQPGVIIDTAGIAAAPVGSFRLAVLDDHHVELRIYNPGQQSPARDRNGWHVLVSEARLTPARGASIVGELYRGEAALWVNGRLDKRVQVGTALSGAPAFLGDYPGDDNLGNGDNRHPAMVGQVAVAYFGPLVAETYVKERGLKL